MRQHISQFRHSMNAHTTTVWCVQKLNRASARKKQTSAFLISFGSSPPEFSTERLYLALHSTICASATTKNSCTPFSFFFFLPVKFLSPHPPKISENRFKLRLFLPRMNGSTLRRVLGSASSHLIDASVSRDNHVKRHALEPCSSLEALQQRLRALVATNERVGDGRPTPDVDAEKHTHTKMRRPRRGRGNGRRT